MVLVYSEAADALVEPRTSASLIRHCTGILQHMAPSDLVIAPSSPAPRDGGMTEADLQALIVALSSGHITTAPAASEYTNTIDNRWSVNHATLMKYTLSASESELAPIFQAIADISKKMERAILQDGYDDLYCTAATATNAPLFITKELSNTIVNLVLWSGNLDRLDEGFHAFCTIYTSTAKDYQNLSNLQTYYFLSNDGTITLEEVCLFQLVIKSQWPTNFIQLDTTLNIFMNLLLLVIKSTHPLSTDFQVYVRTSNGLSIQLTEQFNMEMTDQLLWSFHLCTLVYWQSISCLTLNEAHIFPAANFVEFLPSLLIQRWEPPYMSGLAPAPLSTGPSPRPPALDPAAPAHAPTP